MLDQRTRKLHTDPVIFHRFHVRFLYWCGEQIEQNEFWTHRYRIKRDQFICRRGKRKELWGPVTVCSFCRSGQSAGKNFIISEVDAHGRRRIRIYCSSICNGAVRRKLVCNYRTICQFVELQPSFLFFN